MLACLLLVFGTKVMAQESALSLPEALHLAAQGPAVQSASALREAAGARVAQVQSALWPMLDLEVQARTLSKDPGVLVPRGAFANPVPLSLVTGERDVQSVKLSVSYLLWDWGRTRALMKAAAKAEDAAAAQEQAQKRALLLATVRAFAETQKAQGVLEAAQQALETARETLRVVSAAVEEQLLPESDRLAAEFFLARRQAEMAGAEAQLASALAVLTELTGVAASRVEPFLPDKLPGVPSSSMLPREEVKAIQAQKEAARFQAQAFRREWLPVVVLVGGTENLRDHFLLHQTNNFGAVAMRASLFDGGRSRAAAREQELVAKAGDFAQEAVERQVKREVMVAQGKVRAFQEQVRAAEKAAVAAAEELRLETLRHEQGLASTRDLLAAQEHVAQAKAAVAEARSYLLAAIGELVAASGEDVLTYFGGNQ
ncbi:MAG: TolC family protein [Thermoanaerobaculaceae bacterium]